MFTDEEKDIFVDYSMENEENLKISIKAGLAFNKLREAIIDKFSTDLKVLIEKNENFPVSEWKYENTIKDNIYEKYKVIYVSKNTWNSKYSIGISTEGKNTQGVIIGIISEINDKNLFEKMNNKFKQGRLSKTWNWYQFLEYPYRDWNNKEILLQLYNGTAAKYFVEEFIKIRGIIESN